MNRNQDTTGVSTPDSTPLDTWSQLQPNLSEEELQEGLTDRLKELQGTTNLLGRALEDDAIPLTPQELHAVTATLTALAWECWAFADRLVGVEPEIT